MLRFGDPLGRQAGDGAQGVAVVTGPAGDRDADDLGLWADRRHQPGHRQAERIDDHGGVIEFESQPRRTVFRLFLPMAISEGAR